MCSMAGMFSERVKKFVKDFEGTSYLKDLLHLFGLFFIQGAKDNCCLFCASMPEKCVTFERSSRPDSGLDPACVEFEPA